MPPPGSAHNRVLLHPLRAQSVPSQTSAISIGSLSPLRIDLNHPLTRLTEINDAYEHKG